MTGLMVDERPTVADGAVELLETRSRVRADIQGLRAIAVAAVVVFHLWPGLLPGGFTGVDVFFVVSGFLISGRILREVEYRSPGAFALDFWAARIRRILPAALAVLAVVLIATWWVLPVSQWRSTTAHLVASALSIENWKLAADAVDYGAQGVAPSPVQHFWSLSVEEQFYLGWPLLLLLATLIGRRFGAPQRAVGAAMIAVAVAGFGYSVWVTSHGPAAYFVTPARIWELAIGGLVAFFVARRPDFAGIKHLPWLGLGLIGIGCFVFTVDTPYPGWAALLPTTGTALVLLGGRVGRWSFDRIADVSPVQWLGNVSYSLYLWHWPLIVLTPVVMGHRLRLADTLILLVVMLVLSELSFRFIERPFRRAGLLHVSWRAWVIAGLTIALVCGASMGVSAVGAARDKAADAAFLRTVHSAGDCVGAGALDRSCGDPYRKITPAAAIAGHLDTPWSHGHVRCSDEAADTFATVLCHFGPKQGSPTILLWGDSHASAWAPAFEKAADLLGARVIVASRSNCRVALGAPTEMELSSGQTEAIACEQRNAWVVKKVVPQADIVVITNLDAGTLQDQARLPGQYAAIRAVRAAGAQLIWLRDVPLTHSITVRRDAPGCLELRGQCTNPRDRALDSGKVTDLMVKKFPDLETIDPTGRFCDAKRCYSAIGGVSVFYDGTHLSRTFSESLAPWLARQLRGCIRDPDSCRR